LAFSGHQITRFALKDVYHQCAVCDFIASYSIAAHTKVPTPTLRAHTNVHMHTHTHTLHMYAHYTHKHTYTK